MLDRVELYGDGIGTVEYVDHMGNDLTIVNSARVSFGKHKEELDEKDEKLIKYLVNHGHTSTFEHNVVTFRFVVPLFIRSQHHRHRTWSYNEISRRYTDVDLRFYEPDNFRTQHKSNRQASNVQEMVDPVIIPDLSDVGYGTRASQVVREHHTQSLNLYNSLLSAGVCREQARGVLPQNLYTEYYGTCSLHNALHFCRLRLHEGAQWEIQRVAEAMVQIMSTLYPVAVSAWIDNLDDKDLRKKMKKNISP